MKRNLWNTTLAITMACTLMMTGCANDGKEKATETAVAQTTTEADAGAQSSEEETTTVANTIESTTVDEQDVAKGIVQDDPRNQDGIGEQEILVVSYGTSYNDARVADIKGIEDALQEAYPDWSVRRAFASQHIIDHIQEQDGETIDNMDQALNRAIENGVKKLIVQPTHLMRGEEYDALVTIVETYQDKFETVKVAEPLLGEVGEDADSLNEDKAAVAEAVITVSVKDAGYDSLDAVKEDGVAFVLMGHGSSDDAKISYSQMQAQVEELGYSNVFVGTVEGEPEETSCEAVIEAISKAGYKKVIFRPLMVVAGAHVNEDMAGDDDDSWMSRFKASGKFDGVEAQLAGLGEVEGIQKIYIAHTADAMN